jgi:hypothetical protein
MKKELAIWEWEITKRQGLGKMLSQHVQMGIHSMTPRKIQDLITGSVKTLIEGVLHGSCWITKTRIAPHPTLAESDFLVERAYGSYHKAAVAQGIGIGLGGFIVNLADLPALLTTQVKFLFDCCKLYGFNPDIESERVFILYVFQLAYSSNRRRADILPLIKKWDSYAKDLTPDWETLQIEYRNYMDIAKLLQLLPVVGAVAGGTANHNLMRTLKKTAMNAYRLRIISSEQLPSSTRRGLR